jgi:hypothetical protein
MVEIDFKYYVVTQETTITVSNDYAKIEKIKVHFFYKRFSLKLLLRFGKGTQRLGEHITAIFEMEAKHLELFSIQKLLLYQKLIQRALWECYSTPRIDNFDETESDSILNEAKFISVLLYSNIKNQFLLAPIHVKFDWPHWDNLVKTYDKQKEDLDLMLKAYPNPSKIHPLPAISEYVSQKPKDSFLTIKVWGTVMISCLLREAFVYQVRAENANKEECWGIFAKMNQIIFCNVYAQ